MNNRDHQKPEKKQSRGFWLSFFDLWRTPQSRISGTDPRTMSIVVVVAVASMIFGGAEGLRAGLLLLWFPTIIIFPLLCGNVLCRRFGPKLGMIIASATLWMPIALLWSAKLWMPMLGIR